MSVDDRPDNAGGAAPLELSEAVPRAADAAAVTNATSAASADVPAATPSAEVAIPLWQVLLVLVAMTLAVFRGVGGHGFVYDDLANIQANDHLNWSSVGNFWRAGYASMYIPVTYTFWTAEAELARGETSSGQRSALSPAVFHYGNLALHVVAALLVFLWLRSLVPSDVGALAGAMLFALHPLQAETVNWVTETKGTLAAVFGLTALLLLGRFAAEVRPVRWLIFAVATLALAAALLSKPSAAAIPLIAAVVEIGWRQRSWHAMAPPLAVWLLLVGAITWIATAQQPASELRNLAGPAWRPLVAADAIAFYLRKLVWPTGLCLDYGRTPAWLVQQTAVFVTWLLPVVLLGFLCALPERRIGLVALAVFVAGLAPTLGIVPFAFQETSTVADRYAYLAILGPAIALAWICWRWPRREIYIGVGVVLIACGVLSNGLSAFWRDQASVFQRALAVNPGSVMGNLAIGNLYVGANDLKKAEEHFRAGLKSDPEHPGLMGNLGCALEGAGATEEAAIVLQRALKLKPDNHLAMLGLARLLAREGDIDGAIAKYEEALAIEPGLPEAHALLARSLAEQGNGAKAIDHLVEALRLRPEFVPAAADLMWLWSTSPDDRLRNGAEAVKLGERLRPLLLDSIEGHPRIVDPLFWNALAAAYAETNQFAEASEILVQLHADVQRLAAQDDAWTPYVEALAAQHALIAQGKPLRIPPGQRVGIPSR